MRLRRLAGQALVALGGAVSLLAYMVALGSFLPEEYVAGRTIRLKHSPEAVWQTITDYEGQSAWRRGVRGVERLPDHDGREVWREVHERSTPVTFETTEATRPRRLVRSIADEDGAAAERLEYEITPTEGGGSLLTVVEHGSVRNPLSRFVARFVTGRGACVEQYLEELADRLEESAARARTGDNCQ
ncbi:MAG: SRPBCC family protein [Pyrinomonadaceae bacterium]